MTKQILVLLFILSSFNAKAAIMADPYLWLEDRNGEKAVAWAQGETKLTRETFGSHPQFSGRVEEIHKILTDQDKLPSVRAHVDGIVYDLWQDASHPRGLLRRSAFNDFKTGKPQWETVIDMDALSAAEKTPWVFKAISILPGTDKSILSISRNGQDAVEHREFSLTTKSFVANGFHFPESKSQVDWLDENHLIVTSCLAPEDRNESGYPRSAYLWTRGEEFAKAKRIYNSTAKSDIGVYGFVSQDQGKDYAVIFRYFANEELELFLMNEKHEMLKLPVSTYVSPLTVFEGRFILELRKAWRGIAAGSVIAVPVGAAGKAELDQKEISVVFAPSARSAFNNAARTKNELFLLVSENVKTKPYKAERVKGGKVGAEWKLSPAVAESNNTFQLGVMDVTRDAALFLEEGFLQPRRLLAKDGGEVTEVKKAKSSFDESLFVTEQHWVKSKDGVEIPYTVVHPKGLKLNGTHPTILYGYGGFQISVLPTYNSVMGSQWLAKGGVYVVANIRGGGEFGPDWHQAAILENKQKSYDDFIAVAEDLIARKITSPLHLGIQGGSNGGLLVGAVTMQRPELFSAVLCQIPLLDMIRYTELPPGASWMSEYGDPKDPKMFEVISKYSPYQNVVVKKPYPKMFFQTTQADDRVHPGHARKMVARMKELGHQVYLLEDADGGHGGGGVKPEDQARTLAYLYTYLYTHLATPPKAAR